MDGQNAGSDNAEHSNSPEKHSSRSHFSIISSVKQLPEIQSTFLDACIVSAEVSEGFDFDIRGHGGAAAGSVWLVALP
jgi:hypothetical protein